MNFMNKRFLVSLGLVTTLLGCVPIETNTPQNSSPQTSEATKITMEKYNQVATGMTYEQVKAILGEGTEMSKNEMAGYVTVMYMWQNKDGSNMNVMFQNDAVNNKAQFGLK
jgi:ribosomal protein S17E